MRFGTLQGFFPSCEEIKRKQGIIFLTIRLKLGIHIHIFTSYLPTNPVLLVVLVDSQMQKNSTVDVDFNNRIY